VPQHRTAARLKPTGTSCSAETNPNLSFAFSSGGRE
jgi:hypothetical protein